MKIGETIFLVFLLFVPSLVLSNNKCNLSVLNGSNYMLIYEVFWKDHPYQKEYYNKPMPIAMGELKAGKQHKFSSKYLSGEYFVIWYLKETSGSKVNVEKLKEFKIEPGDEKITLILFWPEDMKLIV